MAYDRMFRDLTRRAALATLGAGAVAALAYALRGIVEPPGARVRLADGGAEMMGVSGADMARYTEMFARHTELRRTVNDIPGGVRTTTESDAPELAAQLKAHVASMYSHLTEGTEVMCMSTACRLCFGTQSATAVSCRSPPREWWPRKPPTIPHSLTRSGLTPAKSAASCATACQR